MMVGRQHGRLLAILAAVAAVVALQWYARNLGGAEEYIEPRVVVARTPIGAETIIRADMVMVADIDPRSLPDEALPNGAVTEVSYVLGRPAVRDIAPERITWLMDLEPAQLSPGWLPTGRTWAAAVIAGIAGSVVYFLVR